MLPLFLLPPNGAREPRPPRRKGSIRDIIIGFVVACLCVVGVTGALVASGLVTGLVKAPAEQLQTKIAPIGKPLTIDNVTVTLTSATLSTNTQLAPGTTPSGTPTQVIRGFTLSLHFLNQTTDYQNVSTASWQVLDKAGNSYPLISESDPPNTETVYGLGPNETLDLQFNVPMNNGAQGPYTLQTGVILSDGAVYEWTFTG